MAGKRVEVEKGPGVGETVVCPRGWGNDHEVKVVTVMPYGRRLVRCSPCLGGDSFACLLPGEVEVGVQSVTTVRETVGEAGEVERSENTRWEVWKCKTLKLPRVRVGNR